MHGFGKFGELKGTPSIEIYGSARIRSIPIFMFISCIYEGASTKIGLHFCSHTKVHRKQPIETTKSWGIHKFQLPPAIDLKELRVVIIGYFPIGCK